MNKHDNEFWQVAKLLVANSEIIIDRPKGSSHPRYPGFKYKVDYGYLAGTSSADGDGIDVWRGSEPDQELDAIICIVDLIKKDSEIKLLIGCSEAEQHAIYETHNETEFMKGILIKRK